MKNRISLIGLLVFCAVFFTTAGVMAGPGDVVKIGKTVELLALDTPGHTMSHVCLLSHTDTPALFCGDTLFNAGAGNCHNGGHPNELFDTFEKQLAQLQDDTLIYPGHDYLINNLQFTMDREPDNEAANAMLDAYRDQDPDDALVTTLAMERQINTFFRLDSPTSTRITVMIQKRTITFGSAQPFNSKW